MREEKSAWGRFLKARMELIAEWMHEGRSVEQIVNDLRVDPVQITLLQMTARDQYRGWAVYGDEADVTDGPELKWFPKTLTASQVKAHLLVVRGYPETIRVEPIDAEAKAQG